MSWSQNSWGSAGGEEASVRTGGIHFCLPAVESSSYARPVEELYANGETKHERQLVNPKHNFQSKRSLTDVLIIKA